MVTVFVRNELEFLVTLTETLTSFYYFLIKALTQTLTLTKIKNTYIDVSV